MLSQLWWMMLVDQIKVSAVFGHAITRSEAFVQGSTFAMDQ
jgi:hypothetical protein